MSGDLYQKALTRVERRLSHAKRLMIINALLFTLFTTVVGGYSKLTHPSGAIDGVVYWIIFGWSILLFTHVGIAYLHSGAWEPCREKLITEEVLDLGDILSLSPDEMLDLHMRLSTDIRLNAQPFNCLMLNALGNVLLWPAMLVLMSVIRWTLFPSADTPLELSSFLSNGLIIGIVGTFLLSFILPVRNLINRSQHSSYKALSAIYGYKSKHETYGEIDKRLNSVDLDADGELTLSSELPKAKNSSA